MNALDRLLHRAEELYRDLRFTAVRDWKQRTGGLAVGFLPVYVPRELLHAMGVLPVGVMGAGDDLEIIRGDAYYQSYICHLPRSVIELGLNGALDCLDGMLFPATCDVIRNLSGMWMMQFPGKYVHYLDVPQDFSPEVGGAFYRHELEQIAEALQQRGARPLTVQGLQAAIAAYNENRRLVEKLYTMRQQEPWKVPTAELYLLLRAGNVLPVDEHSRMLHEYATLVADATDRRPMDQARVLMAGSFCEQPPLGLIKTLERAGTYIVDDDFVQVHRWIRGDVRADGPEPLQDLALAYLFQGMPSAIRYIDDQQKGQDLVARVEKSGAEGVIFCAPSFCDPALLDQPMATAAMDKASVPWTAFKYAENTGQFQVIREQAGTFADSIKLWSE
ncbi:MAG: benzoyl-CoA reductase subunit C [Planctomycetes bacterium]|nr:benzoyl-CoA reductase subunit C [Planctomycetota bacterium]MCC7395928.1 benzoyl-CoA reductase subunit C [Planctomycetota bacterium]